MVGDGVEDSGEKINLKERYPRMQKRDRILTQVEHLCRSLRKCRTAEQTWAILEDNFPWVSVTANVQGEAGIPLFSQSFF